MTVDVTHAPVGHCDDARCQRSAGVPCAAAAHIVHIVGVHDADDVAELLAVAPTVMEPRQMLRLLQDGHVCLQHSPLSLQGSCMAEVPIIVSDIVGYLGGRGRFC